MPFFKQPSGVRISHTKVYVLVLCCFLIHGCPSPSKQRTAPEAMQPSPKLQVLQGFSGPGISCALGFGVLGFRVLGLRDLGLGFRGLGFRVGFGVVGVWDAGFRGLDLGAFGTLERA